MPEQTRNDLHTRSKYVNTQNVYISGLSLQAIQEIINTGTIRGEEVHSCPVSIGGDLPWLKRLLGISPCPQVASLYHEGVWDPVEKVYKGWEVRRTDASDKAHRAEYEATGGSLANSGCINAPIVTHPERLNFVACVLHCSMALGKLLCLMVNRLADARVDKVALQRVLTEMKTGFTVGSTSAPDGEDTHRLFAAWELIAEVLGLDPCSELHKAVVGIREMLKAMYVTKQARPLERDYCAKRVRAFERHCMEPGKGGHYISLLKHDFDLLMHHIYPFGLALFCNDVIESLNRFLKLAYTEHSSRGGGGHWRMTALTRKRGCPTSIFMHKAPIWSSASNGCSFILIYIWLSTGTPAPARHKPPRLLSPVLRVPPPSALPPSSHALNTAHKMPAKQNTIPTATTSSRYLPALGASPSQFSVPCIPHMPPRPPPLRFSLAVARSHASNTCPVPPPPFALVPCGCLS